MSEILTDYSLLCRDRSSRTVASLAGHQKLGTENEKGRLCVIKWISATDLAETDLFVYSARKCMTWWTHVVVSRLPEDEADDTAEQQDDTEREQQATAQREVDLQNK